MKEVSSGKNPVWKWCCALFSVYLDEGREGSPGLSPWEFKWSWRKCHSYVLSCREKYRAIILFIKAERRPVFCLCVYINFQLNRSRTFSDEVREG